MYRVCLEEHVKIIVTAKNFKLLSVLGFWFPCKQIVWEEIKIWNLIVDWEGLLAVKTMCSCAILYLICQFIFISF